MNFEILWLNLFFLFFASLFIDIAFVSNLKSKLSHFSCPLVFLTVFLLWVRGVYECNTSECMNVSEKGGRNYIKNCAVSGLAGFLWELFWRRKPIESLMLCSSSMSGLQQLHCCWGPNMRQFFLKKMKWKNTILSSEILQKHLSYLSKFSLLKHTEIWTEHERLYECD